MPKIYSQDQREAFIKKIDGAMARGLTSKEAAQEAGVSSNAYFIWKRDLQQKEQNNGSLEQEVKKLRAENAKLRERLGAMLLERELES